MDLQQRLYNSIFCGIICETVGAQYENVEMGGSALLEPILPNRRYTDDTDMTLLIMNYFTEHSLSSLKTDDIHRFYGQHFDPSRGYSERTRKLLLQIRKGEQIQPSPSITNGCLMRASAMVPVFLNLEMEELLLNIKRCVSYTHCHEESIYVVYLYIQTMKYLLKRLSDGQPIDSEHLLSFLQSLPSPVDKHACFSLLNYLLKDPDLTLSGFNQAMWGKSYVFHIKAFECFITALFLFLRNLYIPWKALQECIQFGGDVDTVGKILGDMLGLTYGMGWLPKDWLRIENHEKIQSDIKLFLRTVL